MPPRARRRAGPKAFVPSPAASAAVAVTAAVAVAWCCTVAAASAPPSSRVRPLAFSCSVGIGGWALSRRHLRTIVVMARNHHLPSRTLPSSTLHASQRHAAPQIGFVPWKDRPGDSPSQLGFHNGKLDLSRPSSQFQSPYQLRRISNRFGAPWFRPSVALCSLRSPSDKSGPGIEPAALSDSRTHETAVDRYYRRHGTLPLPSAGAHQTLTLSNPDASLLVIGDVHGCLDELEELYRDAVEANGGRDFDCVVLVGDLVNKGPDSVGVVRYVRERRNWYCIRGNHDHGALLAAVGDPSKLPDSPTSKYHWILQDRGLSDADVAWMADLPYTLQVRRPRRLSLPAAVDATPGPVSAAPPVDYDEILVVHAGLVPGVPLEEQSLSDLLTLRTVPAPLTGEESDGASNAASSPSDSASTKVPWASVWVGPPWVVFGHDARRGLQRHMWATGLDTGCCYGHQLTGLVVWPAERLVQVRARRVYTIPGK